MDAKATHRYELRRVGILYPSDEDSGQVQGVLVERMCIPSVGVTAVVGASASGKSSLLNLLAGFSAPSPELIAPDSQLDFRCRDGRSWSLLGKRHWPPAGEVGFVFQDAYLLKNAPVALNVGVGLRGIGRAVDNAAINALLERVRFPDGYDLRRGRRLSGGEAQRVAFCRALACDPGLILADEPTSSLDPDRGEELMQWLSDWCHTQQRALVWVTHNLELAARYADRVIVFAQGRPLPCIDTDAAWPHELPPLPAPDQQTAFAEALRERRHRLATWRDEARRCPHLSLEEVERFKAKPARSAHPAPAEGPGDARASSGFLGDLGFILRIAFCEVFSHTRVDRAGPAAALPPWTAYRHWRNGGSFRLRDLPRAYAQGVLTLVTLLCVLMTFGSLEGYRILGQYFDRELERPEVRHVTVGFLRATKAGQRDVRFDPGFLNDLKEDLRKTVDPAGTQDDARSPVQVFGRRFEPTALFAPLPADGDCTQARGSADNMQVAWFKEPLFQSAPVRTPTDWGHDGPEQQLGALTARDDFDPTTDVVVTQSFLTGRLGARKGEPVPERFCLLEAGARPVRIIGILDRVPGSDQSAFAFLIDEKNCRQAFFNSDRPGENRIAPYSSAAVYFAAPTFRKVWDRLTEQGVDIPKDAFAKLQALLNIALTTKVVLWAAIALILGLAAAALGLIADSYIRQNERAFFVMRAFGHRWRSLYLLLATQMLGVTILVSLGAWLLLLVGLPFIAEPLARGFTVAPDLLGLSAAHLLLPALLVFGVQAAVSLAVSLHWWHSNRFIADRMQTL